MSPVFLLVPLMVLVPLIPAFVLFKTLKTTATATSEEFFGFKVQLGGAFAGYFVLMVLLLYEFKPYLIPPPARLVYHLEGQILDDKQQGVPLTSENIALVPPPRPMISTSRNGQFDVFFEVDPDARDGLMYPSIEVSYGDYLPTDLILDPNRPQSRTTKTLNFTRDDLHQVIYAQPISLSRADAARGDIHVSTPQPIQGVAQEFKKIGKVPTSAPPPGYASTSEIRVP